MMMVVLSWCQMQLGIDDIGGDEDTDNDDDDDDDDDDWAWWIYEQHVSRGSEGRR